MKKLVYIIFALGIVFLGYVLFFHSPGGGPGEKKGQSIICFGDSLTSGVGAAQGKDYPSQLSKLIGKPIINAGVPGDTTARALRRLERDVLSKNPGIVLITLGGNDLKNGVARDTAFSNLKQIVESIQDSGAGVIIGGLKFPFRDRGYGKGYQVLADETGAILIPDIDANDILLSRITLQDIVGYHQLVVLHLKPRIGNLYGRLGKA